MKQKPTKIESFEVIHFSSPEGIAILIYALGDDGVLYELAGGKWKAYPIQEDFMRTDLPARDRQG